MLGVEFWVMGLLWLLLVPAQEKRKPTSTQTLVHKRSQHHSQQPEGGHNPRVRQPTCGQVTCGLYTQWDITSHEEERNSDTC